MSAEPNDKTEIRGFAKLYSICRKLALAVSKFFWAAALSVCIGQLSASCDSSRPSFQKVNEAWIIVEEQMKSYNIPDLGGTSTRSTLRSWELLKRRVILLAP